MAKKTKSGASHRPYDQFERRYVQIKFGDQHRVRLRRKRLTDLGGKALTSTTATKTMRLLEAVQWLPLHPIGEKALAQLQRTAEKTSGRPFPDLANWYVGVLPVNLDAFDVAELLLKLTEIEYAKPVRKSVVPSSPPDFSPTNPTAASQDYLRPAINGGIDADFAWQRTGGNGEGVRVCDVENNWNPDHDEFPPGSRLTWVGLGVDIGTHTSHGTAVMSVIGGANDSKGVKGIAWKCDKYVSPATAGFINVAGAVIAATSALRSGDIILIELQCAGPNSPPDLAGWINMTNQLGMVSVEWDKGVYDAVCTAVANGVIVVAGAGNGRQNLDAPELTRQVQTGLWTSEEHAPFSPTGDSGAIMVGAGTSWLNIDGSIGQTRKKSSNFGSRVNVQGWGEFVVAAAGPDGRPTANLWSSEGVNSLYTQSFAGTSSAAAIVAGACASLQGIFRTMIGRVATPAEMRSLLVRTGTPQTGDLREHIGPLPDLRAAILELDTAIPGALSIYPARGRYAAPVTIRLSCHFNRVTAQARQAAIWYTLDGSQPTESGPNSIQLCAGGDCAVPPPLVFNDGVTDIHAALFATGERYGGRFKGPTVSAKYTSYVPRPGPANFTASEGIFSDHVLLAWQFDANAYTYEIYRGVLQPETLIHTIGRGSGSSWADAQAPEDTSPTRYWIRSSFGSGSTVNYSHFTGPVWGWRGPPALVVRASTDSQGGAHLEWNKPIWEHMATEVVYNVFRSRGHAHPALADHIAEVRYGYRDAQWGDHEFQLPTYPVREFEDVGIAPGILFFYWVIAIDTGRSRQTPFGTPAIGGVMLRLRRGPRGELLIKGRVFDPTP